MRLLCRWGLALLAACLLTSMPGAGRAADPRPADSLDRKAVDRILFNDLRDVINRGADLYNANQDYAGCYRLYEGALMAVRPFLDHRPDLQRAITTGLTDAEREPVVFQRALLLRKVIDRIRDEVNPNPRRAPVAQTMWERLGGEANVRRVVDDLVASAAADPRVDFFRGGKYRPSPQQVADLKQKVVEQISSLTGGPFKYTGRSMKDVHKGMGITDAQFDAFAGHLRAALEKHGAQPADIDTILRVVGGTRKDIVEDTGAHAAEARRTLWDRLGGEAGVSRVVDDLVALAAADPKVDFFRGSKYKHSSEEVATLKRRVVELISSVSGGPLKYTGKSMKEVHKGMSITDAQFDAFADDARSALRKNKVQADDINTVMSVIESTRKDIVQKKTGDARPGAGADRKPGATARLTGRVLYRGKPFANGEVAFHSGEAPPYKVAIAEDGTYDLSGVKPGEYVVTVGSGKGKSEKPTLPVRYADPKTSGLVFVVRPGIQTYDINLQ